MVLSPDEELLLLVTPQLRAILMTREFDPIAEVEVDASQDDGNQVRGLGPCLFEGLRMRKLLAMFFNIRKIVAVHERGLGKEGDAVPRQRGQGRRPRLQAYRPAGRGRRERGRRPREGRLARRRSGTTLLNRTIHA